MSRVTVTRRPATAAASDRRIGSRGVRPLGRVALTGVGVVLVWGALALGGYAYGWQSHKARAQSILLAGERRATQRADAGTASRHQPCVVTAPDAGQLAGVLSIPAIHLTAPVEQGTGDAQLNVAVGHDPSSVWPGQSGTSVLLAHDVSYFVHVNALKPGDQIVYRTACTTVRYTVSGHQVVHQGAPVPDSTAPSLVLDTCYPSDALFFTTQRYLVQATESGISTAPGRSDRRSGKGHAQGGSAVSAYTVAAPASLVSQGLTLQQNEAPMGTMTLSGAPTPMWEQSPGPLDLEAAALEAYFGGIHAAGQDRTDWWDAIAETGVGPPAPLLGAQITGHDAPLDVTIRSTHGVATQVVLSTVVTISGGAVPGTYSETVTLPVTGTTVRIGGWTLTPQ
ncbi:MAG: class D sortase [Acidimicrobiales bacterium]